MKSEKLMKGILWLAFAIVMFTAKFYKIVDEAVINGDVVSVGNYIIFSHNFDQFFILGWQNIALGALAFGMSIIEFMGYSATKKELRIAKQAKAVQQPQVAPQAVRTAIPIKR